MSWNDERVELLKKLWSEGLSASQIASRLGVDTSQAGGQLAELLPGLIDKLTPEGEAPAGGLGNAGDLLGALGSLLQKS